MEIYESKFGSETHRTKLFPGSSVMIERIRDGIVVGVKLFAVGSLASFDRGNLVSYGPIVSIGKKTITIRKSVGNHTTNHRIRPDLFSVLNWDFDAHEAVQENSEAMSYI